MSRTARSAAIQALIPAVERFPDLPLVEPDLEGLSPADARLATAIHRTTIQRWLTLEHLLKRHLKQPMRKMPAETVAILLGGAAQLVLMDRLPAYAVIDESVRLTHVFEVKRTSGVVNAVLRKISDSVVGPSDEPWAAAPDGLPAADGTTIKLKGKLLPKADNLLAHLVVATSHPMPLLQRWFKQHGRERATAIALNSLQNPPTFVVENEASQRWGGSHAELVDWLAEDSSRRVQDPASLASVAALNGLDFQPRTILDLCAGRGTKTRQLQQVYPEAAITAHDPDDDRRADLEQVEGVSVAEPKPGHLFDLIVLDVPCSNTGVLARRPGARYRATEANLKSLVQLQREIVTRALGHLAPGGRLLYCTCSIEAEENDQQARWIVDQAPGLSLDKESTILPESSIQGGSDGHDGSYHAVVGHTPS
ncbi:transcription antitermination factor NusB [Algisphaera agarilytica]|uniref:16S rRNA (Cytosine967-C5)-methyltransferase n=1 Tax=Algisphaera agarilytica TaxID=1385975 RepID=A0A7X0H8E6_9BACT|nr:transcription antitermination factor NusB [Algisphaera agarilytica]MBB6431023.1 16S rRNA (cytosine967-C5)-methyltransferase [Algisphaera agarilytica]